MISAAGIKVYSYLNITAVADFFMEIKPGEHGRVTLRGYLAGMPDVGRLQEEAVRIMLQEDGGNREQVREQHGNAAAGHAALHFFNNERIAGRAPGNRAAIYRIRFRSERPADRDNPQSNSVIPRPQQQVNSGDIRRKLHSARSDHR